MSDTYQSKLEARLNAIRSFLPEATRLEASYFVSQFFAKTPLSDLEKIAPQDACAIALSAFRFAESRTPGTPKIRIFNPTIATDGWESHRLVVELINDDMPFLVDSLSAELARQGFTLFETIHPIFTVVRDDKGGLTQVVPHGTRAKGALAESYIHFEVSALPEHVSKEDVCAGLESTLQHVRLAVEDWAAIAEKCRMVGQAIAHASAHTSPDEIHEAQDFMAWLIDRNFVFLGHAAIHYSGGMNGVPAIVPDSLLGISRLDEIPTDVRSSAQLIDIRKSDRKSQVHRPVLMDVIIVKQLDPKGNATGEHRFYGLFTSSVYYHSVEEIPFVRKKVLRVFERTGFNPVSHDGKALKAIFEFLPRDEMFQLSEDELLEMGLGILALEAKPGVRLFARRDVSGRFISCMVFTPREYFSTELRKQIQKIVEKAFSGALENFYTQITDSPLARLHMVLRATPESSLQVDVAKVEAEIATVTTLWSDQLRASLIARMGEQKAERLIRLYGNAFPPAYISRYDISSTIHDMDKIEQSLVSRGLAVEMFRLKQEDERFLHMKIYNPYEEIALSDILPTLEHMGLKAIEEQPFLIQGQGASPVWIRDFKLTIAGGEDVELEPVKALFEEGLLQIWQKTIEDDRFNALILRAGLTWRQVEILRAYAKYLRQIGFTYGPHAMAGALSSYPAISRALVALFEARFNPVTEAREAKQTQLLATLEEALVQVATLAEDRILRRLSEVIQATLRTNYYQTLADGAHKPVLSFKFNSRAVPELPLPKPYAEIFVHSARVEGIHLRGGKVARGGIRWSDRQEDFRTEVLGLMKAQMVKNSVIVPVGSKGGFIVKQPPQAGGREALQQEGIACYTRYLQGMLDITDNIIAGKVVPPANVIRHDGDDPYLVVAADKGTASFSDTANAVSKAYDFWLGDAFASGGSAGYDHKEMAITARGGWVSVTRHFREMGVDITRQEFTIVGIGDMSGDVFGNGMLLSDNIRLIAAFNHLHIFIDPAPDAKKSLAERKRLFELPRSTWKDYNQALISKGGGVFERSAKCISLSREAQEALGVEQEHFSPDELIRAILRAPVDLLWNGGIGTYVKAEEETHEQVGDRANNAVRINGRELRCSVVGEGGNLGFTQKGRVEYARMGGVDGKGGRINTDAIDNSGGVDCSDHEVNIKIAFASVIGSGKLSLEQRNALLEAMTEEVAGLVLKDNTLQTQAITIAELQGASLLDSQGRLMQALERQGLLDRAIEFLPTDKALAELKLSGKGLTRPEIAVLLAYSKLALYKELIESTLPDEPYFAFDLARYFPKAMQKDFAPEINSHRLRREIIATVMTNSLVNRAGITFFHDIAENTGLPAREIAAAYTVARDAFLLRTLWNEIEALGTSVDVAAQVDMYASITGLLQRVTLWLLRHKPHPIHVEELMQELAPSIGAFVDAVNSMHSEATQKAFTKRFEALCARGVQEPLARRMASLEMLGSALDVITVAHEAKLPIATIGKIYFDLGARLKFGWLRHYAGKIITRSHWEHMAVQSLVHDLFDEQRRLAALVAKTLCKDEACATSVESWNATHSEEVARLLHFLDDLKARDSFDVSVLLVALRHIKMLGA